jgi:hypothetical protein
MTGAGAIASASRIIRNRFSSAPRRFHSNFLSDAGTGASHTQNLVSRFINILEDRQINKGYYLSKRPLYQHSNIPLFHNRTSTSGSR